jgi:hypothetical protein
MRPRLAAVGGPGEQLMPGMRLEGARIEGWSIIKASTTPLGRTRMEASWPPPAGKPGCIGVIGPQLFPWSVDFWTTALASTALYAQLPLGLQATFTSAALGP